MFALSDAEFSAHFTEWSCGRRVLGVLGGAKRLKVIVVLKFFPNAKELLVRKDSEGFPAFALQYAGMHRNHNLSPSQFL